MNTDALLVYVVDRSGSMSNISQATVDGFNTFVKEQAGIEGTCYVSVVLFDNQIQVPVTARDAREMPEMTLGIPGPLVYTLGCSTALRDAVGTAIVGAERWLKNNKEFNGQVIVSILTDGGENASHEWNKVALRQKIEQKKEEGWTFIIQGADDHWMQGADLAFDKNTSLSYTPTSSGVIGAFISNSVGVSNLRTTGSYSTSK
jgi:hypothetical protein